MTTSHARSYRSALRAVLAAALVLVAVVAGVTGCSRQGAEGTMAARVSRANGLGIVATIYPLGDWAREIGAPYVDVRVLLKPGSDPHTYEPTPQDSILISQSKLLFSVGLGLDDWVNGLAQAAGAQAPRVVKLGDALPADKVVRGDPHVWLEPDLAVFMVQKMAAAMMEADPQHAAYFRGTSQRYVARLRALDRQAIARLSKLPVKAVVIDHPAFGYLFRRCGIRVLGVIEESPGKEPTSDQLAELVNKMRAAGDKTIFVEPQFSSKPAQVLAREVGGRLVTLDPLGDPLDPDRSTYIRLIKYNVGQIVKALGGPAPASSRP